MRRYCGAQRRHNRGRCRSQPAPGRVRCRRHAGLSTGPRTPAGKAATVAALVAGRARWIERMRAAKARGEITKIPGGHKPGQRGPIRSKDKHIAGAQRIVDNLVMAKRASLASQSDASPARSLSKADKLALAADTAIDIVRQILALGVDPTDVKLLAQVKDCALSVISAQIRVDEGRLRRPAPEPGSYNEMLKQLGPAERPLEEILAEVEAESPTT